MNTAKLSSKGQIVLPAALRAARAWPPGMQFELVDTTEGVLLKPIGTPSPFAPTRLEDVFGMAHYEGPAVSVAQMHAAVLAEAGRRR